MAREKKPVNWGTPGQTGVSKDGIPWYVPEGGPSLTIRILQKIFRDKGRDIPVGAAFVPARTAAEVRERLMRKYHDRIAERVDLAPGEQIDGFIGFLIDNHVPQPPLVGAHGRKSGPMPVKKWWMGGGWDSQSGNLIRAIGSSRDIGPETAGATVREQVWIRTSHRVIILNRYPHSPGGVITDIQPGTVGIHPAWQPDPAERERVDIAFADGSWLGVRAHTVLIPGGAEGNPVRDLFVELAGPPVTATVLPPRGRG